MLFHGKYSRFNMQKYMDKGAFCVGESDGPPRVTKDKFLLDI